MDNLICFLNFSRAWGGGEEQHLQLAREFKNRGANVILIVKKKGELECRANFYGLTTFSYCFTKLSFISPHKILLINRHLKLLDPKVIVLNGSLEIKFLAFLTIKNPIIIYRRGHPSPIEPTWFNRFLFNKLDIIITNSEFSIKSAFQKILPYCKNYPQIVSNGLKVDSKINGVQYNSKKIIYVGRLEAEKDVAVLIQSMIFVLQQVTDAKLIIVGDGREKSNLISLTYELGIVQHVTFTGFRKDIAHLYSMCSLFVLPSRWETFGMVLIEAMTHKLPTIAFTGHAADEIIDDNETGLLVKNRSAENLSNAIVYLLQRPYEIKRMGENGYRKLLENYTIEKSVDRFEEIINSYKK